MRKDLCGIHSKNQKLSKNYGWTYRGRWSTKNFKVPRKDWKRIVKAIGELKPELIPILL